MLIRKIKNNAKSVEGLAKLLAFGSPPTDFLEEGITKDELIKALKNSGNGTNLIAMGALDTEKYGIRMRYINEWEHFLKTGERSIIRLPEVLEVADNIVSGKKHQIDILKEVSKEYFGARDGEVVLGFVLGEIVPGCKQLEWYGKNSCLARSDDCSKAGYLYYLLSVLVPKEGIKRSGIGLRLAYESTKNLFNETGMKKVNAHSYGIASRELLKKLGYEHITTVKDFYPDTNPGLKDAYLMCITKEKFEKMSGEYNK